MHDAAWGALRPQELIQTMQGLCRQESAALSDFLQGLVAIEEQSLHLHLGFPNMFELCRSEFGLSEGCIYRRLQVARKIRHYPELLQALRLGQLNLTLASMLCPYLGKHAWSELLQRVQGQSKRLAQKALRDLDELGETPLQLSRIQYLGHERYSYKIKVSSPLHHQLERVRELLSHQIPDGNIETILASLTQSFLKRHDPREKAPGNEDLWQHYSSPSRYIPRGLKQLLLENASFQCQYQSSEGRRCGQKRYLDIDHIIPLAAGGQTSLSNLQVLCHAHNLLKSDHHPSPNTDHNHSPASSCEIRAAREPRINMKQQLRRIAEK